MEKEFTAIEKLEIMEKHMRVSWDRIDAFLSAKVGGSFDTREVYGTDWALAKWPIFKRFGDKLSFQEVVEDCVSTAEIRDSFMTHVINPLTESKEFDENDLIGLALLYHAVSYSELRTNIIAEDRVIAGIKISKGMKFSRALKLFVPDKKALNKIQIYLSQFNQELLVKGEMKISVEPMDLLCMSVNDRKDWNSCHDIFCGCYAGGPIAYLTDSATMIAQVISSTSKEGVPDKVWRQILMFDTNYEFIVFSRQYPYVNKIYRKTSQDLLRKNLSENAKTGFVDYEREKRYGHSLNFNNKGYYHYNDITHHALDIIPVMALEPEKYGITGENDSKEIMRSFFDNPDSSKFNSDDVKFVIGTYDINNPRGHYVDSEDIDEYGLFSN